MVASLFLSPLPDMGGVIFYLLGFAIGATILGFMGIVLVEAFIFRLMEWGSVWISLLDSFLVNLVTIILGLLLASDIISLSPGTWVMMWGASVATEGILLQIIRRQPVSRTWTAALFTNVVSYAGLYFVYLLLNI